ncbi:hypothetical protein TcCL_Unassigned04369, partial [Trypanosoma cruzi]
SFFHIHSAANPHLPWDAIQGQPQDAGLCLTSCWRLKLREFVAIALAKALSVNDFKASHPKKYWQNIIPRRQHQPQKAILFCYTWEAFQCPFPEAIRYRCIERGHTACVYFPNNFHRLVGRILRIPWRLTSP